MIIKKNENSYRLESTEEITGWKVITETGNETDVPASKQGEVWGGDINDMQEKFSAAVPYLTQFLEKEFIQ